MNDEQAMVYDFHKKCNLMVQQYPQIPMVGGGLHPAVLLRLRLIMEETTELAQAFGEFDIVGVADALGDLLYVVYGAALACGLDMADIFREIHRSNMSKEGYLDPNGKFVRTAYSPPKLANLVKDRELLGNGFDPVPGPPLF